MLTLRIASLVCSLQMIVKIVHYVAPDKTENRLREHDVSATLDELLQAVIGPGVSLETHTVSYYAHDVHGIPLCGRHDRIIIGDESEFKIAVKNLEKALRPPSLIVEPRRKVVSGVDNLGGHFLGRMSFGRLGFGPNGTPNDFGRLVREMICSRLAAEDDIAAEVHVHDRSQEAVANFYRPPPSLTSRWTVHAVGLRADRTLGITGGAGKALEDIGFGGIDVTFRQTGQAEEAADEADEAAKADEAEEVARVVEAEDVAKVAEAVDAVAAVSLGEAVAEPEDEPSLYAAQSSGPGEPYVGRFSPTTSYTVATERPAASVPERHRALSTGYTSSDGGASYTAASTDSSTYTSKGKARVEQLPVASGPYKSPEELGVDVTRYSPLEDLTADHLDDMAIFVDDGTVADGTVMEPGCDFVKTWIVRNDSSIAWPEGSMLRFVGGDAMDGVCLTSDGRASELGLACAPGETVHVSVRFTSPRESMPYISHWRMTTPDGQQFGHRFWVEIVVEPRDVAPVALDESIVSAYMGMGFPRAAIVDALVAANGDAERALDILLTE